MRNRRVTLAMAVLLLICLPVANACGDDPAEPGSDGGTTPALGDVSFSPEILDIGAARTADFILRNESGAEIGSLLTGVDDASPVANPGLACTSILSGTAPPSIVALEPGEQTSLRATFFTDEVDLDVCPPGEYEADVIATTNSVAVGRATVRFEVHEEPLAFGDIDFTPTFVNIGSARVTTLVLRNNAAYAVDPVEIELDRIARSTDPDAVCGSMRAVIEPASFSSLASGEERDVQVTIDTSGSDCEAGQYDVDLSVRVGLPALGGATIRFDWTP